MENVFHSSLLSDSFRILCRNHSEGAITAETDPERPGLGYRIGRCVGRDVLFLWLLGYGEHRNLFSSFLPFFPCWRTFANTFTELKTEPENMSTERLDWSEMSFSRVCVCGGAWGGQLSRQIRTPRVVRLEVGTSRSALLLTVRVESGIARTKSNNGPRGWLSSLLVSIFIFSCALSTHTHTSPVYSLTRIRGAT